MRLRDLRNPRLDQQLNQCCMRFSRENSSENGSKFFWKPYERSKETWSSIWKIDKRCRSYWDLNVFSLFGCRARRRGAIKLPWIMFQFADHVSMTNRHISSNKLWAIFFIARLRLSFAEDFIVRNVWLENTKVFAYERRFDGIFGTVQNDGIFLGLFICNDFDVALFWKFVGSKFGADLTQGFRGNRASGKRRMRKNKRKRCSAWLQALQTAAFQRDSFDNWSSWYEQRRNARVTRFLVLSFYRRRLAR